MKKIIAVTLILLSTGGVTNAQNNPISDASTKSIITKTDLISKGIFFTNVNNSFPEGNRREAYLQKSRNLKTAGWCFLGVGAVGLAIGLASFPTNADIIFTSDEDQAQADRATTITIIGSALMLGSTPFFVLANVNKRKASLSFSSQKTGFGVPSKVGKTINGIKLTVPIGK